MNFYEKEIKEIEKVEGFNVKEMDLYDVGFYMDESNRERIDRLIKAYKKKEDKE